MSILIDAETTFIVQGITGREAVNLTRECLDYGAGAKIVGGVTPGPARGARSTASRSSTPSPRRSSTTAGRSTARSSPSPRRSPRTRCSRRSRTASSSIVIVTERIPRRDVAQMVELATLHGARIIGPNCLGIIVPDVIKMGGIGGPAKDAAKSYTPGPVGVISPLGRHDDRDVLDADRRRPRPVDRRLDRRRRDHRLGLRRADAAVRGRRADRGDRDLHRAGRAHGGPARRVGDRARLAAADRRVHGRPLHGRDAGHVASATPARSSRARRTRRRRRSPASRRPGSRWPRRSRRSPTSCKAKMAERRPHERATGCSSASRSTTRSPATRRWRPSSTEVCPVDIFAAARTAAAIVEGNLDECVLCRLCLDAAPHGTRARPQALRGRGRLTGASTACRLGACLSSPRSSGPGR